MKTDCTSKTASALISVVIVVATAALHTLLAYVLDKKNIILKF